MKKLITLALFIFLIYHSKAQLNINELIRVGQTRIQIENYTGAIEYFNIVIKFKPYLPEAYFYRGIAKHQLEDYRGAIQDYNKAIEIKPYYPQAYINRGLAYHSLKEYDKAIKDYDKALEFDPKNESIYNNRGILKLAQKDVKGAMEDFDKALELNPKSTYALMNRSNAKIVDGDILGAIKDLNQVIIIRPHYSNAYLNRGLIRLEQEDYASALRDFDQCILFDSKNSLAYNNRGIVKHRLEDYEGAIMDYTMAIQLNPEMASAYFNRAMAREILGKPGFETDYKIAAELNPQFDLESRRLDAEQLAQNQQNQQNQANQNTANNQQSGNNQGQNNTSANNQNNTTNQQNNTAANNQNSGGSNNESATRDRRRRVDLIVEDNRNLPNDEDQEVVDGRIQDKNIEIDLQPIFVISAFEKNAVDYDRFQYYNLAIDELNEINNYNPQLTISNKPVDNYRDVFENFILFFNAKIDVQQNAYNYLNRGIFKSLTGKFNDALNDLNQAIKLDNNLAVAYFSRANCHFKMLEEIESASVTNNITIPVNQGKQNASSGQTQPAMDYSQILEDYETVLKLNPKFFFGYYNRAYIKLKLQKYSEAIDDLNRAIELEPEFAEAYFNRGLTKIYLDDIEGGALDLSRAGELGINGAYNIIKRYCN